MRRTDSDEAENELDRFALKPSSPCAAGLDTVKAAR
jgi:hypothetical protein